MTLLDEEARTAFIREHPDWSIDGEELSRTFVNADFNAAMGFVTRVAIAAEVADHHPDIAIRWNKVTLTLTTHEKGGLTERDTALASQVDGF